MVQEPSWAYVECSRKSKKAKALRTYNNKEMQQFLKTFFKKILFIFGKRGKEGEKEREKHQCVVASSAPPTGDLACIPGMCPDWELNC